MNWSKQNPEASVNAESLGGKLWLKGRVPSPMMAHNIVSLAKRLPIPIVGSATTRELRFRGQQ